MVSLVLQLVLGFLAMIPIMWWSRRREFGADAFSAHLILKEYLDRRVANGELVIEDTDLASRQFLELSMAAIYKRRLFGNLPEPAPAAQIAWVVDKAADMFLSYYGKP